MRPCLKSLSFAGRCHIGVVSSDIKRLVTAAIFSQELEFFKASTKFTVGHVIAESLNRPNFFNWKIYRRSNSSNFWKIWRQKGIISPGRNTARKLALAFSGFNFFWVLKLSITLNVCELGLKLGIFTANGLQSDQTPAWELTWFLKFLALSLAHRHSGIIQFKNFEISYSFDTEYKR